MMLRVAGFLLVVFGLPSLGAAQSISTIWKARAIEAGKKLELLQAKLKKIPEGQWDSKEAKFARCEAMLESAYALHVAMEDVVHKVDGKVEVFHIVLSGGDEGAFDIAYLYSSPGTDLVATRIDKLTRGWQLFFLTPGSVQVNVPNSCVFNFELNRPFTASVLRNE